MILWRTGVRFTAHEEPCGKSRAENDDCAGDEALEVSIPLSTSFSRLYNLLIRLVPSHCLFSLDFREYPAALLGVLCFGDETLRFE